MNLNLIKMKKLWRKKVKRKKKRKKRKVNILKMIIIFKKIEKK